VKGFDPEQRERLFYTGFGALTLLLASLPYLYGALNTPRGHVYTGLTFNIDDVAVYLSWMRQAADGHFFQRNLFNTGAPAGHLFSLFSLLLGGVVRLMHLSLPAVYHTARVVFGGLFLWAVTRLLRETLADGRARQIAYALVCVSSGLGWLTGGYDPARGDNQPIDLWQPEAITFLSLYYTPLFVAALALMVVFVTAMLRSERSGRLADIWPAAVAGALLGNFHTYDVIHLFSVWTAYRVATDVSARRADSAGWRRLIVTGLAAMPTTAYTYYALTHDTAFGERDVKTLSPSPLWVAVGFGLVLFLAVVAVIRPRRGLFAGPAALRLMAAWAVVGIAVSYLPVDFQRKMLMGVHVPLCVLAGAALAALTAGLSGDFPKIAAAFGVLLTTPSNALFLMRDVERLQANIGSTENRPYLTDNEADALTWLRDHSRPGDAVLVSPDPTSHRRFPFFALKPYLAVYVPAFTGDAVYDGHWSETASYGSKWQDSLRFFRTGTEDAFREELLRSNGIRYVLYANALGDGPPTDAAGNPVVIDAQGPYTPVDWMHGNAPSYLRQIHRNAEITVYAIARP
jgi:hypothetical protein